MLQKSLNSLGEDPPDDELAPPDDVEVPDPEVPEPVVDVPEPVLVPVLGLAPPPLVPPAVPEFVVVPEDVVPPAEDPAAELSVAVLPEPVSSVLGSAEESLSAAAVGVGPVVAVGEGRSVTSDA